MEEKWMTLDEVADHLQVSKDSVYRLVQKNEIPASKIGNLWRFKKEEVDEWFKKRSSTPDIVTLNPYHIRLRHVERLLGFSVEDVAPNGIAKVLARAFVCSDDPEFYLYSDQISKLFLNKCYLLDGIHNYLILIHRDLSADVYVNNIPIQIRMLSKRNLKVGEPVRQDDIANITELRFIGIDIKEDDCVIFCFKKGWKFGLFFDFCQADQKTLLDIDGLYHILGGYYRYLTFQEVYSVLETGKVFEALFSDGWFPFIQLLGGGFQELAKFYKDKKKFSSAIEAFIDKFDGDRIRLFVERWWANPLFKKKQKILEAGINAYISGTNEGYITCIKTLYSEIEGIIRIRYVDELGNDPKFPDLIAYVERKAESKFGPRGSLGFSDVFYRYLKDIIFKDFDLKTGKIDLSRHTTSHGVADEKDYNRMRALQAILILDQMYFYLT